MCSLGLKIDDPDEEDMKDIANVKYNQDLMTVVI